jgi:hypothetical protein
MEYALLPKEPEKGFDYINMMASIPEYKCLSKKEVLAPQMDPA